MAANGGAAGGSSNNAAANAIKCAGGNAITAAAMQFVLMGKCKWRLQLAATAMALRQ